MEQKAENQKGNVLILPLDKQAVKYLSIEHLKILNNLLTIILVQKKNYFL